MTILAGDIGGTKTILALFTGEKEKTRLIREAVFPSRLYPNFEGVLKEFFQGNEIPPRRACFGVAGPVLQGRSETTHLPWIVDAGEISRRFAISSVALLNDLEATAYGALALTEDERSLPKAFNSGSGSAERNKLPSGWGSCPNHFRNAVLGARSLAHLLKAAEEAVRAGV